MANTLTGLIPEIYDALDVISRELVGAIPSVGKDSSPESAAIDQTIRIPIAPASSLVAITPGLYAPDNGNQTIGYVDMTVSKSYMVPVRWNGEEQISVRGIYNNVVRDQFAQAFRAICNQVEQDLLTVAYKGASRAYGTAGVTPFATDLSEAAQIKKILDDNGAPSGDRTLVINTTAGVNLRSKANLMTVNASGTDQTLRNGILLPVVGLDIRESAGIQTHTKGTMTGGDCTAIEPVAETTIAIDGTNSGTILNGDVITRGNEGGSTADANKYVISSATQTASAAASGNMIINNPGLRLATTVADEWTIGGNYTANVAFHRSAVQLLTRAPAMPEGGDCASDVMIVTDPFSGISFQIAQYKQFRQVQYQVGLAWGYAAIKPEHIAILLG